ncbi:MAG TPA: hypothetical protein VLC10_03320 [Patescibacteria group bacterium]|nr:hypothetical protein [Patescibacteria group bacterium]
MPQKPPAAMASKNPAIVMSLAALVVGAAAGYFAGVPQRKVSYEAGYRDGTAAGVAQTKKMLADAVVMPKEPEMKVLDGIVKAIGTDTLTIETHIQPTDPFGAPIPATRTVRLSSTTKITASAEKDPEVLKKEMEAFRTAQAAALRPAEAGDTNGTTPEAAPVPIPSPTEEKEIALAKITVGSAVSVTAESDILRAESIDATSVRVITLASADTTPPQLAPLPTPDHDPSPEAAPVVPPAPPTEPPKPIIGPPAK